MTVSDTVARLAFQAEQARLRAAYEATRRARLATVGRIDKDGVRTVPAWTGAPDADPSAPAPAGEAA